MKKSKRIVVLGDGGWGTTLAILLSRKGYPVVLWSAFEDYARLLERKRENVSYLKGIRIPKAVRITPDLSCLETAHCVVVAVPSQYLRGVLTKGRAFVGADCPVVSVVKGIENRTLLRMSQVISEVWPDRRVSVLSGPTIAQEVARGIPTTAVASSCDDAWMLETQDLFMAGTLRVYANPDVVGVELGGSLKNIIAIACGISDGLGFGTNTKAAIVSRGLVEMARLGESMGARRETFAGIAGLGDLVTTCFNTLSRNHFVGEQIGKGIPVRRILAHMKMVAEGVPTSKSAWMLGKKYEVELPIISEIYHVLFKGESAAAAVDRLMLRAKKTE